MMLAVEKIESPEALEAWLKDMPPEWSAVIALRIALRVFPLIAGPIQYGGIKHFWRLTGQVIRALTLSAAAGTYSQAEILGFHREGGNL